MNFLLFSDVHASKSHCEKLVKMSREADIVIGAGDFGKLRREITRTIQWLSGINKPSVIVPGNAESFGELKEAAMNWPESEVLHGSGIEINGIYFYGIGGGIPLTPFGSWSYDLTEKQAAGLLKECPEKAVLVTHSPPHGILDVSSSGDHLGSKAIREVIEKKNPRLVVCGHIHESAGGMENYGSTTIVNAGPDGMFYDFKD